MPHVQLTTEPNEILDVAGGFLATDPVLHNVILTLLADRVARRRAGRYWWVEDDGAVAGVAFQSPLDFSAAITPMELVALDALVPSMIQEVPDLPGVVGEASVAAAFAGRWCERRRVSGTPEFGMRLHVLGQLITPAEVPGTMRRAGVDDLGLATVWARAFAEDTHGSDADPEATARRFIEPGLLFIWEDTTGQPVSCAAAQPPQAGVSRVNFVYTPPDRRRKGYAAACVAGVSAEVQKAGNTCMLYTDLANPTSNAIYQRLGYRAVAEATKYRFG